MCGKRQATDISKPGKRPGLFPIMEDTMRTAYLIVLLGIAIPTSAAPPAPPTIDLSPLFENLNGWMPQAIALLAVPAGIVLAIAFARFIIRAILEGFGRDV